MNYECTEERFLSDVKDHKLTVLKDDDDVYRHIIFAKPGTSNMKFGIVTWPGHLCFYGDMGTYVFCRLHDMFNFFRKDVKEHMTINPSYWAEKVEASDKGSIHVGTGSDGISEFSEEKFKLNIVEWIEDFPEEKKQYVIDEIYNDSFEFSHDAYNAVGNLKYKGEYVFQDFWETSNNVYCFRYIWCCYALVWAINQYDKFKQGYLK